MCSYFATNNLIAKPSVCNEKSLKTVLFIAIPAALTTDDDDNNQLNEKSNIHCAELCSDVANL